MATRPQCIITGCTLLLDGAWQSGDLFVLLGVYIFNASGQPSYDGKPWYSKTVTIEGEGLHFERRNVYVFSKDVATLNDEARSYINGDS